ncbi:MAG: cytochrome C oxidase subunit IV family protein [Deltaproteobacteria bacterium]|nr:cytochrome C oxidase subunit IV family protein [Deltaproteobacteria bacterium]
MSDRANAPEATAEHVPHVLPLRNYLLVWAALLGLTATTVGVSYLDFGDWNIAIALLVASIKAALVAAVFMHLAYDKKFNGVVFLISLVFLVIMLAFTFFDTRTRGAVEQIEGMRPKDYTAPFVDGKPASVPLFEESRRAPEKGSAVPAAAPGPAAPAPASAPAQPTKAP